jgi:proline iminopeptidase
MIWKRVLKIGLGSIAGVAVLGIGSGLIWHTSAQRKTEQGRLQIEPKTGVNELFKVNIGGIPQWFHARGGHKSDPVLFWLHGGPGTPMMPFESMWQNSLEEHFIVVHWDQRGSGKTYFEAPAQAQNSYALMLSDAQAALGMIKQRYNKQRVVIVGHSWGSTLGIGLVQTRPQDVAAYVGTGQVVDITQNERQGYLARLAEARRLKNATAIKELEGIEPYPEANGETPDAKIELLRKWEDAFGFGISRRYRAQINDVMPKVALASPEYGLKDVSYFLRDTGPTPAQLDRDMDTFKVDTWGKDFKVPMFLFLGRHDWQTPSAFAAPWLDTITAPSKQVIWFEKSAHSPMVDEPEAFAKALIEIVRPVAVGTMHLDAATVGPKGGISPSKSH